MSAIHPSAVIEPGAQIDDSVEIGAYAVIGAYVRIGARCRVGSHTVIEGHTTIGADTRIGHFASVGGEPQDMKYRGEPTRLEIGERNVIREYVTIHTGTVQDEGVTRVGDDNWIMAYVHIAHDCVVGSHTVFASNAQIAGHVQVGDWAILGGMCGVHQFVRIGAHAMLGGASVLRQDVPPYIMAAGDPARPHGINIEGLRRRGFAPEAITALRTAYRTLYKSDYTLEQARDKLGELVRENGEAGDGGARVQALLDFVANAKRGIIR
jgi:UDP-N-acetylglucosamine acyltransferase